MSRLHHLDGLRALLVMGVMLNHVEWYAGDGAHPIFRGGWLPVEGFFVLSGFLIAGNLLRELDRDRAIDLPRFYFRRLARLYPALVMTVGLIFVVAVVGDHWRAVDTWPAVWTSLTYTNNFAYLLHGPMLWHVGTFWSLGIEMQFYVVFPLVLLVLHRLRARPWVLAIVFGAIAIASATWRAILGADAAPKAYTFPLVRLDGLMLGVLLALSWRQDLWRSGPLARLPARWFAGAAIVATAALLAIYFNVEIDGDAPYRWAIAAAGVCSVVIIAWLVRSPDSMAARVLSLAPLAALGRRSYSAYLTHYGLFLFLAVTVGWRGWPVALVGIPGTWVLSDLMYRFVERPMIEWSHRVSRRRVVSPSPELYGSLHH